MTDAQAEPEVAADETADETAEPSRPRLWLVRHGQTEWARLGRHTGRTDIALTEDGRDQARAVGRLLSERRGDGPDSPFALVLSSPLGRAATTAALAGFDDATIEPDLAEWDYGALEGLTTAAIRRLHPEWTIWTGPWPDGETVTEVGARADHVLSRAHAAGGDVLVFSHGHLLRILAARWLGLDPSFGRLFGLATGTLSILGWDRENPVVELWNEDPDPRG
jgi:probable phosphoglycerate mutase